MKLSDIEHEPGTLVTLDYLALTYLILANDLLLDDHLFKLALRRMSQDQKNEFYRLFFEDAENFVKEGRKMLVKHLKPYELETNRIWFKYSPIELVTNMNSLTDMLKSGDIFELTVEPVVNYTNSKTGECLQYDPFEY